MSLNKLNKKLSSQNPEASPEEIEQAKEQSKPEIAASTKEKMMDQVEDVEPEEESNFDTIVQSIFAASKGELEREYDVSEFYDPAELPEGVDKDLFERGLQMVVQYFEYSSKQFEAKDRGFFGKKEKL